jgi:hypothetical protein
MFSTRLTTGKQAFSPFDIKSPSLLLVRAAHFRWRKHSYLPCFPDRIKLDPHPRLCFLQGRRGRPSSAVVACGRGGAGGGAVAGSGAVRVGGRRFPFCRPVCVPERRLPPALPGLLREDGRPANPARQLVRSNGSASTLETIKRTLHFARILGWGRFSPTQCHEARVTLLFLGALCLLLRCKSMRHSTGRFLHARVLIRLEAESSVAPSVCAADVKTVLESMFVIVARLSACTAPKWCSTPFVAPRFFVAATCVPSCLPALVGRLWGGSAGWTGQWPIWSWRRACGPSWPPTTGTSSEYAPPAM